MSVCLACKGVSHSERPPGCRGGTWCDCNHRLPIEVQQKMNEESATSSKLIETGEPKNV